MMLQNKIDFMLIFTVDKCNPNGDPLLNGYPRTDYDGFGIVTDVCLKRKIRDRAQEMGKKYLFNQMSAEMMNITV